MLINVRNNKKLLGRIKAFDRHCNMVSALTDRASVVDLQNCVLKHTFCGLVHGFHRPSQVLENVKEMWTEVPKAGKVTQRPISRENANHDGVLTLIVFNTGSEESKACQQGPIYQ